MSAHHPIFDSVQRAKNAEAERDEARAALAEMVQVGWVHPAYGMTRILSTDQKAVLEARAPKDPSYYIGWFPVFLAARIPSEEPWPIEDSIEDAYAAEIAARTPSEER